jgi:hypothetical protein
MFICDKFSFSLSFAFLQYFVAFDSRSRSVRELLRQVQAKRYSKSNPNMSIAIDVHDLPDAPMACFTYVDGSEVNPQSESDRHLLSLTPSVSGR